MTEEIWKDVPGFEGCYQVSNLGRVRSFKKPGSVIPASTPQRILRPAKEGRGYLAVSLHSGDKQNHTRIHQLVMLAFVGPCPDGLVVCHNDDDPSNNHLTNLRYDTQKSNIQDAIRNGTFPTYKVTKDQVKQVYECMQDNQYLTDISDNLDIPRHIVNKIANGKMGNISKTITDIKTERNQEIRDLYATGNYSLSELGKKFNLSPSGISRIVNMNRGSIWEGELDQNEIKKPTDEQIKQKQSEKSGRPRKKKYQKLYETLSDLDIDKAIRVSLDGHTVSNLRTKISTYGRSNSRKFMTRVKGKWLYIQRVEVQE